MRRFFEKIYSGFIVYEKDFVEMDKHATKKAEKITEKYGRNMDKEWKEYFSDDLYELFSYSEKEGFLLGAKCLLGFSLF